MSAKNKLQEHFQKLKLDLPKYSHEMDDAIRVWTSTVTLPTGEQFKARAANKVDADQMAASQAVIALNHRTVQHFDGGDRLILIDLENAPQVDSKWLSSIWNNCQIEAFVGALSPLALRTTDLKSSYPFVHRFRLVNSGYPNAVDYDICMRVGAWMQDLVHVSDQPLYRGGACIISRDRFAPTVVELTRAAGNSAQHFTCIDECLEEGARGALFRVDDLK